MYFSNFSNNSPDYTFYNYKKQLIYTINNILFNNAGTYITNIYPYQNPPINFSILINNIYFTTLPLNIHTNITSTLYFYYDNFISSQLPSASYQLYNGQTAVSSTYNFIGNKSITNFTSSNIAGITSTPNNEYYFYYSGTNNNTFTLFNNVYSGAIASKSYVVPSNDFSANKNLVIVGNYIFTIQNMNFYTILELSTTNISNIYNSSQTANYNCACMLNPTTNNIYVINGNTIDIINTQSITLINGIGANPGSFTFTNTTLIGYLAYNEYINCTSNSTFTTFYLLQSNMFNIDYAFISQDQSTIRSTGPFVSTRTLGISSYSFNNITCSSNGNIYISTTNNALFLLDTFGNILLNVQLAHLPFFTINYFNNIEMLCISYSNVDKTIFYPIFSFPNLLLTTQGTYNLTLCIAGNPSNPQYYINNLQVYQNLNLPSTAVIPYPNPIPLLSASTITLNVELYGTQDNFQLINNMNDVISSQFTINAYGQIIFTNVIIPYGGNNEIILYDTTTGAIISIFNIETSGICFKEGTKILCVVGKEREKYIKIEELKQGMKVRIYAKDSYKTKQIKFIVKSKLYNSQNHTINKLFCLKRNIEPELLEDLYITGSHSLLHTRLTEKQTKNMKTLAKFYNNYKVLVPNEQELDEIKVKKLKNKTKSINDFKLLIEDKYKLLAYYDERFEEINDVGIFNIYHIVLENKDKYGSYGIYANGILAETTTEASLERFPNYKLIEHKITDKMINTEKIMGNFVSKGIQLIHTTTNKYKWRFSNSKTQKFIVKKIRRNNITQPNFL
jgi:hypothetical protein